MGWVLSAGLRLASMLYNSQELFVCVFAESSLSFLITSRSCFMSVLSSLISL